MLNIFLIIKTKNFQINTRSMKQPQETTVAMETMTLTSNQLTFTCDVDSPVEQIIGHIFYTSEEMRDTTKLMEDFALKVI